MAPKVGHAEGSLRDLFFKKKIHVWDLPHQILVNSCKFGPRYQHFYEAFQMILACCQH